MSKVRVILQSIMPTILYNTWGISLYFEGRNSTVNNSFEPYFQLKVILNHQYDNHRQSRQFSISPAKPFNGAVVSEI